MLGIRTFFQIGAGIVVTNSTTLVTTGLISPIAANQTQKIRAWLPITVGAAGGVRALIAIPAAGIVFEETIKLFDTVAQSLVLAERQVSSLPTVFKNALANAGDHWLELEATIINGATAGDIEIQVAQNTPNALSLTVKQGGSMEVIKI